VISLKNADNLHGLVLLNTHFTACASAVLWLMAVFLYTGQSSYVDILYGVMAGLAG
jgi:ammonia channel protein AmtB